VSTESEEEQVSVDEENDYTMERELREAMTVTRITPYSEPQTASSSLLETSNHRRTAAIQDSRRESDNKTPTPRQPQQQQQQQQQSTHTPHQATPQQMMGAANATSFVKWRHGKCLQHWGQRSNPCIGQFKGLFLVMYTYADTYELAASCFENPMVGWARTGIRNCPSTPVEVFCAALNRGENKSTSGQNDYGQPSMQARVLPVSGKLEIIISTYLAGICDRTLHWILDAAEPTAALETRVIWEGEHRFRKQHSKMIRHAHTVQVMRRMQPHQPQHQHAVHQQQHQHAVHQQQHQHSVHQQVQMNHQQQHQNRHNQHLQQLQHSQQLQPTASITQPRRHTMTQLPQFAEGNDVNNAAIHSQFADADVSSSSERVGHLPSRRETYMPTLRPRMRSDRPDAASTTVTEALLLQLREAEEDLSD
jgi:hypothetical protein